MHNLPTIAFRLITFPIVFWFSFYAWIWRKLKSFFFLPKGDLHGIPFWRFFDQDSPYSVADLEGKIKYRRAFHEKYGATQYYVAGKEDSPVILLVHGISPPAIIFFPMIKYLSSIGYKVIAFDLYGRGYSDAPDAEYDLPFYHQQIDLILKREHVQKFSLLGFSLGGSIAVSYYAKHLERIEKLILLAPTGCMSRFQWWTRILIDSFISEAFLKLFGTYVISHLSRRSFKQIDLPAVQKVVDTAWFQMINHPGYLRAYLKSIRNVNVSNLHREFLAVHQSETPLLLIWGNDDHVVPYVNSVDIMKLVPKAEFKTIHGAGHQALLEHEKEVHTAIKNFLKKD